MHPYVAQQPDELTLELADILNILDKTEDGEAGPGCVSRSCPPAPRQPEAEGAEVGPCSLRAG